MKPPLRSLPSFVALVLLAFSPQAFAVSDAEAAAGRALVKSYADTVIGVELVVTLKYTVNERSMPSREDKREVNGTVISPTGLTVTSLAAIDPRSTIPAGANMRIEEPDFKEVKLRLADNTEVPARVVLKDADLDLAFIAPDGAGAAADRQFAHVKLEDAAEAAVLGAYYDVSRAPKALQRTPTVRLINMSGIVEKPRRLFLLADYSPGCPVFDAGGRILGVSVRHIVNGRQIGLVILPAAAVADIARQAAAATASAAPAAEPAKSP